MEAAPVVIVGGGPAGVTLALELIKNGISSVILEKEREIEQDPRAAVISGDSVRIMWDVGIGDRIPSIGTPFKSVSFHRSTWLNPPFLVSDRTSDVTNQVVPDGIRHVQPMLEQVLRDELHKHHQLCDFRSGCEVVAREEIENGVVVEYRNPQDELEKIKCSWLVGADGKRGIVRKQFLEKQAGVRQEIGLYDYTGTWIAANLKITVPSLESDPDLPFWKAGLSPEQVYDLYWPNGWHFCSPPGRPTACGSLGPREERWWRHEFKVADWDESTDAKELLWEHITPMITRTCDACGRPFPSGQPVTFPRKYINVKRCRPYTFAAKVVNRWFSKRTILIGDAAHTFPPFAGQGMASGLRDAQALAWRLALLIRAPSVSADQCLNQFARERRQGIDDATKMTIGNAILIQDNQGSTIAKDTPPVGDVAWEIKGYKGIENGFFSAEHGGGGKMAQIYVRSSTSGAFLSDALFHHGSTAMTILVIDHGLEIDRSRLEHIIEAKGLPESVLSKSSITHFAPALHGLLKRGAEWADTKTFSRLETLYPCPPTLLSPELCPKGYDPTAFQARLGANTRYTLIRPDWIIFAVAADVGELSTCLDELKRRIGMEE